VSRVTTKSRGDAAETFALNHLLQQGLQLVQRNYRVARGPRARGAEIDLVMTDKDGSLVFVEVRARQSTQCGGASASIDWRKQQRCVLAAQHFLRQWHARHGQVPACRFDVVCLDGAQLVWLPGAFTA
jgi:putative endonuclease